MPHANKRNYQELARVDASPEFDILSSNMKQIFDQLLRTY